MNPQQPQLSQTQSTSSSQHTHCEQPSELSHQSEGRAQYTNEEKHRCREQNNWRIQNWIGGIGTLVTFLAMCAACIGGYIAWLALNASWQAVEAGRDAAREAHEQVVQAQEQTKIAQEGLDNNTRPWLLPEVEISSLELTGNSVIAHLLITTTNNGHVPVFMPTTIAWLMHWPGYPQAMITPLFNVCREASRELPIGGRSGGLFLPPQQPLVEIQNPMIPQTTQGKAELVIFGCIAYEYSNKPMDIHETSFVFHLGLPDPDNILSVRGIDLSFRGIINQNMLRLTRDYRMTHVK
jgi:hypothetical protein